MAKFYCLDCDSTFMNENVCPYCESDNFDVADEDDGDSDGRDFTPPYEP